MQAVVLRQESASRNNMAQSEEALVTGIVQDHGIGIRLRSPRGIRWGCLPPWLLGQQNKRYRRNDPDQPPGNHSLKSLEDMFFALVSSPSVIPIFNTCAAKTHRKGKENPLKTAS